MEPFNIRLHEVIRQRVDRFDLEMLRLALMFIAADKPTVVVRALDLVEAADFSESDQQPDS